MNRESRWTWTAHVLLLALFLVSLYLALNRIYQVDECQNVFTARILSSRWERGHNLWAEIWHVWPLAWLASLIPDSVGLYHASRLFMLVCLWLSIILTAVNCGISWRSRIFPWVLLGAATLSPLWDYGFEIRHDNLLVLLLLVFLHMFRRTDLNARITSLLLGVLAALQLLVIFKSPVYWLPLAILFLALPPKDWRLTRPLTLLFGCIGFFATIALATGILSLSGRLPFIVDGFTEGLGIAVATNQRFSSWNTFGRLLQQSPLIVGVAVGALGYLFFSIRLDWRENCTWEGILPEALLVTVSSALLLLHPMPLPYHLCLIVPFAFILGIRWLLSLPEDLWSPWAQRFLWAGLITFTHAVPFLAGTWRHFDYLNDRQEKLMILAEQMTDPSGDRVYDAAGLVASRPSIGRQWFLHTLFQDRFDRGDLPTVGKMLEERPASVLIPNYRFGWLKKADVDYIQANYLSLANDFLVLGRILKGTKLEFPCLQAGRYYIELQAQGMKPDQKSIEMDGARIPVPSVQLLSRGEHRFAALPGTELVVTWVGPKRDSPPSLPPGDSRRLFVNWY